MWSSSSHPARKDFTDLELALRHARSTWGRKRSSSWAGLGARWDQTLANLLLPAAEAFAGVHIRLLDGAQEVFLLRGGETAAGDGQPGRHRLAHPARRRRPGRERPAAWSTP